MGSLTRADILATSRWVWRRLTALAPVAGSRHAVETSGGRWRDAPRYRPCRGLVLRGGAAGCPGSGAGIRRSYPGR
jgi:hypothetical protein